MRRTIPADPIALGALTPEERQARRAANQAAAAERRAARQALQAQRREDQQARRAANQAAAAERRAARQAGAPARQEQAAQAGAALLEAGGGFLTGLTGGSGGSPFQPGTGTIPGQGGSSMAWGGMGQGIGNLAQAGLQAATQAAQAGLSQTQGGQFVNQQAQNVQAAAAAYGLPTMAVSSTPGPWVRVKAWQTAALKPIARQAALTMTTILATMPQHAPQVKAALDALAQAKRNITQAEAAGARLSPSATADLQKLSLRWLETASGLLVGATYTTGAPVTSLGASTLTVSGIKFSPFGVAFAVAGGANYAKALSRDTAAVLRAVPDAPPPTAVPGLDRDPGPPRHPQEAPPRREKESAALDTNTMIMAGAAMGLGLVGVALVMKK